MKTALIIISLAAVIGLAIALPPAKTIPPGWSVSRITSTEVDRACRITTLNEIVRNGDTPFPDLVKIDAEGSDLRVLAGASELIGKTDVFLLEVAIGPQLQHWENTLGNVILTMAHLGYGIFDLHDLNHGCICEASFLRNASDLARVFGVQ
jgi:hypothetical protein